MAELSPQLRIALNDESDAVWEELNERLLAYAIHLTGERKWRGQSGGVPPDGYDPESIVNEAFTQLFEGSGWEPKGDPYTHEELRNELRRLVYNIVHKIARRVENRQTSNGEDLRSASEVATDESFFENVAGASPQPDNEALRREAAEDFRRYQAEVRSFLADDPLLVSIFDCICAGVTKRNDQALRLGISPQQVTNARKRLDRKLDDFAQGSLSYPETIITEMKNA